MTKPDILQLNPELERLLSVDFIPESAHGQHHTLARLAIGSYTKGEETAAYGRDRELVCKEYFPDWAPNVVSKVLTGRTSRRRDEFIGLSLGIRSGQPGLDLRLLSPDPEGGPYSSLLISSPGQTVDVVFPLEPRDNNDPIFTNRRRLVGEYATALFQRAHELWLPDHLELGIN